MVTGKLRRTPKFQSHAASVESRQIVRAKMQEEVLRALRRTALLSAVVILLFIVYDYFEWRSNYIVRGYPEAMYYVLLIRLIGVLPTVCIAAGVLYFIPLKGAQVQVVNLLLIMGPFIATAILIFLSPEQNAQYAMCLTLFQVFATDCPRS